MGRGFLSPGRRSGRPARHDRQVGLPRRRRCHGPARRRRGDGPARCGRRDGAARCRRSAGLARHGRDRKWRRDGAARRGRDGVRGWSSSRRRLTDIGGGGARAGFCGRGRWRLGRRLGDGLRCGQDGFGLAGLLVVSGQGDDGVEPVALVVQRAQFQLPNADHGGVIAQIPEEPDQGVFHRVNGDSDGLGFKELFGLAARPDDRGDWGGGFGERRWPWPGP